MIRNTYCWITVLVCCLIVASRKVPIRDCASCNARYNRRCTEQPSPSTNIIIKSAWAHRCAEIWDECEIHCALTTHGRD
ncbi:Hypothetical predicted protein [Mytilus galloprovincialis]|uniref:Uncharacterized protein n=1 Tax=Mytilus galloprovincialis TaxID=29158 RepID=A0A8B6HFX3_MYTGA|nr:Hypothetical predicted protein [Mytilus galloprovincialis]